MATVLIPLPRKDFDPTEAGVPWAELTRRGHQVRFATPDGQAAQADPRMVHGTGLGPLRLLLQANKDGVDAYRSMASSPEFLAPLRYSQASATHFDVEDGRYLSARWPGDAHLFAVKFANLCGS